MAKHTDSNIDIDTYSWSELMALTLGDATYSAVLEEAKIDASTAIPASQISAKVGALYANTVGVVLEELWTKARAGGGGAQTVYELDWTAQGSQTISADQAWTVDGNDWTSANQAQSSAFAITNGTGLVITGTSGSSLTWTQSSQTAPGFWVDLADLSADVLDPTKDLWIWTHISAYTLSVSNNSAITGLWSPGAGGYSSLMHGQSLAASGASVYSATQRNTSWTNVTGPGSAPGDVLVWRCTGGVVQCYVGTWSAGWPSTSSLIQAGGDLQPEGTSLPTSTILRRQAGMRLVYSAATRATTGAPSMTVAHTRIQVGP